MTWRDVDLDAPAPIFDLFPSAAVNRVARVLTHGTCGSPAFISGGAYLLYLAWKLWSAPVRPLDSAAAAPQDRRRLLAGLAINLGNPKVIVFFLALLPTVVDLGALTRLGFAELALLVVAIASTVLAAYALAAARARRLLTSRRAIRLVNRGSGAVMAGAAVAIIMR